MVLSLHGLEGNAGIVETTTETTTKTSELILDAITKNPFLTNKELAAICGITADGVYYQLKQLKTIGKIAVLARTKAAAGK